MVEGRENVAGEFARFLEDRLDEIFRDFLMARQSGDPVEAADDFMAKIMSRIGAS